MVRAEFNTVLALGANLPIAADSPRRTIALALEHLARAGLAVQRRSALYSTPAHPPGSGPDFVNAAVAIRTDLPPRKVLTILHEIESAFGRTRAGRWGPRTLDIDLIAMGDKVAPDPQTHAFWRALSPERQESDVPEELILPHPRLQDRAFVLVPMADVAPGWRHPLLGQDVAEMLEDLPRAAVAGIRRLD